MRLSVSPCVYGNASRGQPPRKRTRARARAPEREPRARGMTGGGGHLRAPRQRITLASRNKAKRYKPRFSPTVAHGAEGPYEDDRSGFGVHSPRSPHRAPIAVLFLLGLWLACIPADAAAQFTVNGRGHIEERRRRYGGRQVETGQYLDPPRGPLYRWGRPSYLSFVSGGTYYALLNASPGTHRSTCMISSPSPSRGGESKSSTLVLMWGRMPRRSRGYVGGQLNGQTGRWGDGQTPLAGLTRTTKA